MGRPTLFSTTNFVIAGDAESPLVNTNTTPTQRMISLSIVPNANSASLVLLGYGWMDVRDNNANYHAIETYPIIAGQATGFWLPDFWAGSIWRVRFIPVERLSGGSGSWRIYTVT